MTPQLKQARLLLENWVGPDLEPLSVARAGFHTLDPSADISSWAVETALYSVGLGFEAWDLIERVVQPPAGLMNWLRASERRTSDVLSAFAKAIQRSKKLEGR